MSNPWKTEAWQAIDRALHDVLVVMDRDVLRWIADETETTSILQDKANEVLDYINPQKRAENDGTTVAEAVQAIVAERKAKS